jgi:hypothetical protein
MGGAKVSAISLDRARCHPSGKKGKLFAPFFILINVWNGCLNGNVMLVIGMHRAAIARRGCLMRHVVCATQRSVLAVCLNCAGTHTIHICAGLMQKHVCAGCHTNYVDRRFYSFLCGEKKTLVRVPCRKLKEDSDLLFFSIFHWVVLGVEFTN